MNRRIKYLLLSLALLLVLKVGAQDVHFSQFYHSPQLLNPALIGTFKGDFRAASSFRSQWSSVPVPYQTFTAGADGKLLKKVFGQSDVNGGIQFLYDQAGDIAVRLSEISIGSSLTFPLTREATLSGGLQLGLSGRRLDPSLVTTASQYNGEQFNENAATNEIIDNPSLSLFKIAVGVNVHYIIDERKRGFVDFGLSMFNLTYPTTNFKSENEGEDATKIPARGAFYLDSWWQSSSKVDLKGHALWHFQGDFSQGSNAELVVGTGIRYHLSLDPDKEKSIAFLTSYRLGDAVIPSLEVGWRSLTAVFSYDFNTSPFRVATNRRGGPEFSLVYILTKPTPPKEFKSCPVF